jgi:hypothetical protein
VVGGMGGGVGFKTLGNLEAGFWVLETAGKRLRGGELLLRRGHDIWAVGELCELVVRRTY